MSTARWSAAQASMRASFSPSRASIAGSGGGHRNAAADRVETPRLPISERGVGWGFPTLAADGYHRMLTVIIVVHLMLVIALIGVVLLQKSEGGGLVSSTSGFLTGRGTANVLTRTTALLAAGFFATSLALSWLASFQRHPASIINTSAPAGQE